MLTKIQRVRKGVVQNDYKGEFFTLMQISVAYQMKSGLILLSFDLIFYLICSRTCLIFSLITTLSCKWNTVFLS